jgi:predicted methyltransferase
MISVWNDEDEEVFLATHKVVCPRCNGKGVHDAWEGGMTSDEMNEQGPDFIEDYMSGAYDVVCSVCHGKNVVDEVNENDCDPELLEAYYNQQRVIRESYLESEMERRMGC